MKKRIESKFLAYSRIEVEEICKKAKLNDTFPAPFSQEKDAVKYLCSPKKKKGPALTHQPMLL